LNDEFVEVKPILMAFVSELLGEIVHDKDGIKIDLKKVVLVKQLVAYVTVV
jgi:hypothetical protein